MKISELEKFDDIMKCCASITKTKKFDVSRVPEQLLLVASEMAECLEVVIPKENTIVTEQDAYVVDVIARFITLMKEFETFRAANKNNMPSFSYTISDKANFKEEIADTFIRLFSFCGIMEPKILNKIKEKIKINKKRPVKHGKAF